MFGKGKRRLNSEVNSSSMADIAFLLLIFFLVTTNIKTDEYVQNFTLPPPIEDEPSPIPENNLFIIKINSTNELLIEKKIEKYEDIRKLCKEFITNNGKDPESSDNPQEAIITLGTNRSTKVKYAMIAQNEILAAYHEVRAEALGISLQEYMNLDDSKPLDKKMIERAKAMYPMRFSKAEPKEFVK